MNKTMPELQNIVEMIHRYNALHKEGCFIFSFVGFKKDIEHKCVDCGEDCDLIDDDKSLLGAFGDKEILRDMINGLRDMIEDEADEDGFVCV